MLWLDMGLGKTVVTLTSIAHLIEIGSLTSVIIVAPIRVINLVWRQEAARWEHTKGLTFSCLTGSRDKRTRALLRQANVYLINYENLGWLAETIHTYFIAKKKPLPFNGVVWDEISKMKNSATQRVKAVKKILPHLSWRTGLTGTPSSNGYGDLHGQYLVVDGGQRLGTSKTAFKARFYHKVGPYKEVINDSAEEIIKNLIGDVTLEMSAEDYNPLPSLIVNNVMVELPPDIRAKYELMEKEFFIRLDSGAEVEMFNQAALTNKCLQFSNGAMYPMPGLPVWEPIHTLKLEALEEIIEESGGRQILCAYAYRSDAERIMTYFKELDPINLTACKTEASLNNAMYRWTTGDCRLMIGHPACLSADTQVLTERDGWVNIIDVRITDRVFDGVEYVSHDGCFYSGHKEVIEVFGIWMTPNHKLLIDDAWIEAKDIQCPEKNHTPEETIKEGVFDLVNCGPRHRFVIRNAKNEVFISHNSMGHGIDGLQKTGGSLVWFGLTWSLDLYDQFNARIRRQGGSNKPVICHRIMTKDTLDQAQCLALGDKAESQTSLRKAVKEYRLSKHNQVA